MMNRATFIEKLTKVQITVEQLLAQLQASEADRFVAHLYQSRKQYRLVGERPNKGNRAVDREVILPSRAEPGLQGRLPLLGALAANTRVSGFSVMANKLTLQTEHGSSSLFKAIRGLAKCLLVSPALCRASSKTALAMHEFSLINACEEPIVVAYGSACSPPR
jgi:hypothetical protein